MAFFSIVVPVFNRANLISETLNSIFQQKFEDWEVIVVDDGSTDNTLNVLSNYENRIQILQQKNQGPGQARNLGIQKAQGKYVAFLDSDDIWFPWTLEVYAEVIQQTNFPALLAGEYFFFHHANDLNIVKTSELHYSYYQDFYASSDKTSSIVTSSVVARLDVLKKAGGFTDKWINSEDNDLWLRLGTAKGFIYINSPTVLGYRQQTDSAVSNITKTYQGTYYLIQQENTGQYPGDKIRQRERINILTRHIRPVSLACLRHGDIQQAWKLYQKTFKWHLWLGRLRYLLGFLFMTILAMQSKLSKKIYRGQY
ncbi:glycosyltransferase family 2 protein [Calothrix sp. NIES-2098]|uniref:glycosyltransferase family 2 protein n=1 Tax=Calothrix sp. NIES-2098 TaxID=1954171 RepID=UPI000B60DDC1|nr:family 2 glycosyl transferase [Calothrix sp. NIES-2098]